MGDFAEAHKKALQISKKENWIKFVHEGYAPAQTDGEKEYYAELAKENKKHCAYCLNVNGCCFVKDKMPMYPHHPNCHCKIEAVNHLITSADSMIEKFTKYLFDPKYFYNGKAGLFFDHGYDIMDSEWLREVYIKQANEKYANGDYKVGSFNDYGQRISINLALPLKDGSGEFYVITGWMVYPDGKIMLTTPMAGDPREKQKYGKEIK